MEDNLRIVHKNLKRLFDESLYIPLFFWIKNCIPSGHSTNLVPYEQILQLSGIAFEDNKAFRLHFW